MGWFGIGVEFQSRWCMNQAMAGTVVMYDRYIKSLKES